MIIVNSIDTTITTDRVRIVTRGETKYNSSNIPASLRKSYGRLV